MIRIFTIILMLLFISQCSDDKKVKSPQAKATTLSSQDTTIWQGTYRGTVPSKKSIGMDMRLTLNPSNTYDLHIIFLEKNPNDNKEGMYKGAIRWEEDSVTFSLNELDTISNKFRIRKDMIEYLNPDGTPNTGQLAEFYILKRNNP